MERFPSAPGKTHIWVFPLCCHPKRLHYWWRKVSVNAWNGCVIERTLPKGVLEIRDYVCPSPATEEWGEAFDRMREQNFATQVRPDEARTWRCVNCNGALPSFTFQLADYQQKASEKLRKFTGTQTKSEALSSEQKTLESNQMEEKAIRHVEAADSCSFVEGTNPSSTGVEPTDARLIQAQPLEQNKTSSQSMWVELTAEYSLGYLPSTLVFASLVSQVTQRDLHTRVQWSVRLIRAAAPSLPWCAFMWVRPARKSCDVT